MMGNININGPIGGGMMSQSNTGGAMVGTMNTNRVMGGDNGAMMGYADGGVMGGVNATMGHTYTNGAMVGDVNIRTMASRTNTFTTHKTVVTTHHVEQT